MINSTAPLNPRQLEFVREYVQDRSAPAAYIRAGYKARGLSAHSAAARLLVDPRVEAAILEADKERVARLATTADDVVKKLVADAFADPRDVVTWTDEGVTLIDSADLTPEQAATIAEIKVVETKYGKGEDAYTVTNTSVKLHSHQPALHDLAKHFKLLIEHVELGGPGGGPIPIVVAIAKLSDVDLNRLIEGGSVIDAD